MTKTSVACAIFVCAMTVLSTGVSAQDLYITPAVVYTDADDDRLVDNDISGGQITLGKFMGDVFAIEGVVGSSSLEGDSEDLDLTEIGMNARWVYNREGAFSPFMLVGFGFLGVDSDLFSSDDSAYTNYGVGFELQFGDGPMSLRADYRIRDSSEGRRNLTDKIATLGLSYAFGSTSRPMPEPAPAPEDPDSDGDGVPDSRDDCPNTPAGHQVDSRGCSLDGDGDGVVDADDQCPGTYRGATVDARGCELDDDDDGVVNRLDECPDTPAGARVDTKGCEIKDVIRLPGVNFETNSDRLLSDADNVLRDAATTLRRYPELVVEVAGHTDSSGADDYNQGLSERRAATVRDYLVNAGVGEANLSSRGYGEEVPIADNETDAGRAENRRVELRIIQN